VKPFFNLNSQIEQHRRKANAAVAAKEERRKQLLAEKQQREQEEAELEKQRQQRELEQQQHAVAAAQIQQEALTAQNNDEMSVPTGNDDKVTEGMGAERRRRRHQPHSEATSVVQSRTTKDNNHRGKRPKLKIQTCYNEVKSEIPDEEEENTVANDQEGMKRAEQPAFSSKAGEHSGSRDYTYESTTAEAAEEGEPVDGPLAGDAAVDEYDEQFANNHSGPTQHLKKEPIEPQNSLPPSPEEEEWVELQTRIERILRTIDAYARPHFDRIDKVVLFLIFKLPNFQE
jgi:hypothetical protein